MNANDLIRVRKRTLGMLIAIFAVLFMTVSVAYAILYTISTTDGHVNEWSNQNIPLFQSDPVGDVSTPDEDIINAWVAAEDSNGDGIGDTINFLVEVNGSPALSTNVDLGGPPIKWWTYRVVVASLDCNYNDVHEEPADRLIIYNPTTDIVEIRSGDQQTQFGPNGSGNYGQRVGAFLEWGIPIELMGGGQFDEPVGHCSGEIGVRFVTATAGGTTIDQTAAGPFDGIRIPTAVSVSNFGAAGATFNSVAFVALVGLVIIGGLSGIILLRRRQ